MQTLTVANQKGGVGKTANACILTHHLVRGGNRTLAIDLDHQRNFTKTMLASGKPVVTRVCSSQLLEHPWELLKSQGASIPEGDLILIPADPDMLMLLERQQARHNAFATNFCNFLRSQQDDFQACIIDTNPNPDIRMLCALIGSKQVLSPIQLNQEAIDGVGSLLHHKRVGIEKICATLNPGLELIGLLPSLVKPSPFQKENFTDVVREYGSLLIRTQNPERPYAYVPDRSVIAEAQASGELLWEMKKTAGRDTWREIEPAFTAIVRRMKLKMQAQV